MLKILQSYHFINTWKDIDIGIEQLKSAYIWKNLKSFPKKEKKNLKFLSV